MDFTIIIFLLHNLSKLCKILSILSIPILIFKNTDDFHNKGKYSLYIAKIIYLHNKQKMIINT